MRKFSKRLLTVVLAFAMVFGLSGMTAFATEVGEQDAAAGSEAIPEAIAEEEAIPLAGTATYTPDYTWYTGQGAGTYTISSAEQLAALSEIVNGTADGIDHYSFRGQTVELDKHIDCIDMNEDAPVSWSCVYPDDANYNGVADIWDEPVWTWSDDFSYAEVTRTCKNAGCEDPTDTAYASIADGSIITKTIEPGERTGGATSYTATATFDSDGTTVEDTQNTDFKVATGCIDIAIYRSENKTETSKLLYSAINEAMEKTDPQTFTYTSGSDHKDIKSVTDRFVSIAALLNITDTINDACCYYVKTDEGADEGIYLPTSACIYFRGDTLTYRTAVDGYPGSMWVDSPTSIDVLYQHDWGDLEWEWSREYDSATVKGRCQMDVCGYDEEVTTTKIASGKRGEYDTLTATAAFSDGTVVTDTIYFRTY